MPELSAAVRFTAYPRLAALNFGIQFVWGALLAVSLQARSIELAHDDGIRAYTMLAAAGAAAAAATQVLVGSIADARCALIGHRREFYRLGIIMAIPALLWFFVAPSLPQLTAAFLALQITLNIASGPYQAAIPDHVPPERHGEVASWMSGFQSLGNAAGLIVAGFVHEQLLIGLILAAGLAVSFGVTLAYVSSRTVPLEMKPHLRIAGPLTTLLISRGSINLGFYALLGFLLFFVRDDLGVHDSSALRVQTALIFLTFTLCAVIGSVLAGKSSDRYDKRLVVTVANATIIIALASLAGAQTFAGAYAAAMLAGIAWGAFATADWALACCVLPRNAMATAMGAWNLATAVPQIVAPLISMPIYLYFNAFHGGWGPRAVIVFSLCAFAVGTVFVWNLPPTLVAARHKPSGVS